MFNGLKRGLELIAGFLKIMLHAFERGNTEALTAGFDVARQWIHETVDTSGKLAINLLGVVTGTSDPWKVSRMKYQEYASKYPELK